MSSPFPGVDPFLEAQGYWPDFHSRFITYWCEAIADRLPTNYEARIDERVRLVERDHGVEQRIQPDVAISRRGVAGKQTSGGGGDQGGWVAALEPVTLPLPVLEEGMRESFIEIRHRSDRSLVAVLELLSPANKEEPGRAFYLAKRSTLLLQLVHLIELDLLLSGRRLPFGKDLPTGHYFATIAHADRRFNCDVYAWTLRQPLPPIPIPLRAPDPDIMIDLGTVFAQTYDRGRYAPSIDYRADVNLPLAAEELAWIKTQAAAIR